MIDSQNLDHEALNHVLQSYDLPDWSEMRKKRDSTKSIKENFPVFFGADADNAYQQYIEYLLSHKDQMKLFAGVKETLEFLKENGIPVIVISNRDKNFVADMISHFGLNDLISHAVGAGDTGYSKPDSRLLTFALDAARVSAKGKSILFVGDALADMHCAEDAESFPVLMRAAKTDVTDEWVARAEKEKKEMWVIKDYPNFLGLLKESLSSQQAPAAKNHNIKKTPKNPS